MPSRIMGKASPLATLMTILVDGLRAYTCLELKVIYTVAPESIIHGLFMTDAETFKALPLLHVSVSNANIF